MPPAPTRMRRCPGDVGDHHRRGGTGDTGHVVVFRQPVTGVAAAVGELGEFSRVAQRIGRRAAGGDRREIEHRKGIEEGMENSVERGPSLRHRAAAGASPGERQSDCVA